MSKKLSVILSSILVITTLLITASIYHCSAKITNMYNQISSNTTKAQTINNQQPKKEKYILKLYNNKVALFTSNSSSPKEIYTIDTSSLMKEDINILTKGIKIYSDEELASILEDYLE